MSGGSTCPAPQPAPERGFLLPSRFLRWDRLAVGTTPAGAPPIPPPGGPSGDLGARGAPGGGERGPGLWKGLRGLEDITRLSAGGRRSEFRSGSRRRTRRVRGRPRHKARFVLRSPRELEPMDWRQLRSSVRQRRGSGPGKGPRGRAGRMGRRGSVCAGPLTRLLSPGALRQVAASPEASF